MSSIAYIDCSSGISGDMFLAAMIDLGMPLELLEGAVSALGLESCALRAEKISRGGIAATSFSVGTPEDAPARNWKEIRALISKSSLEADVKEKTLAAFQRLARCEAAIHDTDEEHVHFHELSGVDTIVDVAGAFIARKWLGAEKIFASPVNVGSGFVNCRHGILPVPAPATAELLRGTPIFSMFDGELTTPTGALVLTGIADCFGPMPLMKTAAIGLGAGTREGGGHPNILRIFTGEQAASGVASEQLLRVETNIDDMNPQIYPYLIEKLLVAGALDAYCVPAVMKKGRPAIVFSVLCREEKLGEIFSILISETTSLGARISRVERLCIDRRVETVETAFGAIKIKIGIMDGRAVNVMPEYEDCAAAAARCGAPLAAVMEAARAAAGK